MQPPSLNSSLGQWLAWLEKLHPVEIDLGLERVTDVAKRMDLLPAKMPVILVGGTNGKGSTVNLLNRAYQLAGYKTGAYTSPHIQLFNERMSISGQSATDQQIVSALHAIEQQRGETSLTYFEYTTLAAMLLFNEQQCDVVLMEVGLGGRLDATNIWDADCSVITSIALDHQAYLGDTRELVAIEKVAIGRPNKPLVVGEPNPPAVMQERAAQAGMDWIQIPEFPEISVAVAGEHQRRNAACAVEAINRLQSLLPVSEESIAQALVGDALPGRFELIEAGGVLNVLDVAHNPAAATALAATIAEVFPNRPVQLVLGAMADKDVAGVVSALQPIVTKWFSTGLKVERALSSDDLAAKIEGVDSAASIVVCENVGTAWVSAVEQALISNAGESLRPIIVVVGSFYLLSALHDFWQASDLSLQSATLDRNLS